MIDLYEIEIIYNEKATTQILVSAPFIEALGSGELLQSVTIEKIPIIMIGIAFTTPGSFALNTPYAPAWKRNPINAAIAKPKMLTNQNAFHNFISPFQQREIIPLLFITCVSVSIINKPNV